MDGQSSNLLSCADFDALVPSNHPLRTVQTITEKALASREFAPLNVTGGVALPPHSVLRAIILQLLYTIPSQQQLLERLEFDLLFRWFIGMAMDDPVWDAFSFSSHCARLLEDDAALRVLRTVLAGGHGDSLLSSAAFSVDGSLFRTWFCLNSQSSYIEGRESTSLLTSGAEHWPHQLHSSPPLCAHCCPADPEFLTACFAVQDSVEASDEPISTGAMLADQTQWRPWRAGHHSYEVKQLREPAEDRPYISSAKPVEPAAEHEDHALSSAAQAPFFRAEVWALHPDDRPAPIASDESSKLRARSVIGTLVVVLIFGLAVAWSFRPFDLSARQLAFGPVADTIIHTESSGCANARNGRSTALGAGQFLEQTWLELIRAYRPDLARLTETEILELRRDPQLAREMTVRFAQRNSSLLRARGLPVTSGTIYLAHFAGPAGAVALLSAPDNVDAATVMARADVSGRTTRQEIVRANPFLQQFTVADLRNWAERKMRAGEQNQVVHHEC